MMLVPAVPAGAPGVIKSAPRESGSLRSWVWAVALAPDSVGATLRLFRKIQVFRDKGFALGRESVQKVVMERDVAGYASGPARGRERGPTKAVG